MLAVARDRAVDLHARLLALIEASRVADAEIAMLLLDMQRGRRDQRHLGGRGVLRRRDRRSAAGRQAGSPIGPPRLVEPGRHFRSVAPVPSPSRS